MISINVLLFLLIIILILIIVNIIICTNTYKQKFIYNGGDLTDTQDGQNNKKATKQERLISLKKELSKSGVKNGWFSEKKLLDKVSNWLNNSFSDDTNIDQIIKCYTNYKPLIKFLSTYDNYYNCYEITGCSDFYVETTTHNTDGSGKHIKSIKYDLYDGITGKYKKTVYNKEPPDCSALRDKRGASRKKSIFFGGGDNNIIPTVEIPAIEIPTAEIPTAEIPTTEISTTEIPTAEMPTVEMPTVEIPTVEIPTAEIPTAEIPAILTSDYTPYTKESTSIKYNVDITKQHTPIHKQTKTLSTNISAIIMDKFYNPKNRTHEKNMMIYDDNIYNSNDQVIAFFGICDDKTFGRNQVQIIAQDPDYKKNSFSYRKCIYTDRNGMCKKIEVRLPLIAIRGNLSPRAAFNKLLSFIGNNNNLFLDFVKDESVLPEFIANYKYEDEWVVRGLQYDATSYSDGKDEPYSHGYDGYSLAKDISQANALISPNLIDISSKIIHCDDSILVVCLKYVYNNNLI